MHFTASVRTASCSSAALGRALPGCHSQSIPTTQAACSSTPASRRPSGSSTVRIGVPVSSCQKSATAPASPHGAAGRRHGMRERGAVGWRPKPAGCRPGRTRRTDAHREARPAGGGYEGGGLRQWIALRTWLG